MEEKMSQQQRTMVSKPMDQMLSRVDLLEHIFLHRPIDKMSQLAFVRVLLHLKRTVNNFVVSLEELNAVVLRVMD